MNKTRWGMALLVAMLLFAGCKDLFHPPEPEPTNNTPPPKPTGVRATVLSSSSISVSWNAIPNVVGYTVYRSDSSSGTYSTIDNTDSTTYTDSGLSAATRYYYKVSAYWNGGTSELSSSASATTKTADDAISNITYSSVSGGTWTLQSDGRYQSPAISDNSVTKSRISFTSNVANASITIQLDVSSQSGYDYAFISTLDNDSATYSSGYYSGSRISGTDSVTVTIPVPTTGSHFIDIGYRKNGSISSGNDCAWFKVTQTGSGSGETITVPSDLSLADSLTWISNNVVEGGNYTITVRSNETIVPKTLSYSGKNVSITITGGSTERTVSLSSTGSLFTVESGVTLTLGNNLTLQGRSGNTAALVTVNTGGTLVMNTGSKASGNTASSGDGGGVYVSGGTFTMSGGTISGNTASGGGGGGVFVYSGTTFTMSGGTISGNTSYGGGGGVFVYSGTTFTMSGGTISGNTASGGGGVSVGSSGTFTMSGGAISGNTATSSSSGGGGVSVGSSGTFTMSGGTISGNTSSNYGGGVLVDGGTFTKQSGGTIYGSDDASSILKNTATYGDSYGHAVYINSSPAKKRNTTAGEGVTLDSSVSGSSGGWGETMPTNLSLEDTLTWISNNAEEGGNYSITVRSNETIAPKTLSYSGKNVSITLTGSSRERTVSLSSTGSLFTVESGVTLTLDNNLTLQGRSDNTAALVRVNTGGTLVMNTGSTVSGNTTTSYYSYGGGVYVSSGTFTMNGGTISGNTAYSYGGGVYVSSSGTFTKQSGGTIYGSDAYGSLKNTANYGDSYGHAVYINSSPAKKRDTTVGEGVTLDSSVSGSSGGWAETMPANLSLEDTLTWISNNAAEGDNYTITVSTDAYIAPKTLSYSGKNVSITLTGDSTERTVYLTSTGSLFTVESGVTLTLDNNLTLQGRSDNTAALVYVNGGTLVMNTGSKVSGNTSSTTYSYGGGMFVYSGTFTMNGGTISGNTSYSYGGGVFVYNGTFTMSGGTMSGNTSSNAGGGVFVDGGGTFTKQSGGTIYGSDASGLLANTAYSDSYGHAVYVYNGSKKRDTTAGEGVTLDSSVSGSSGGWEETMPTDLSLADSLTWISNNAVEGGNYTITLSANDSIAPKTLSYSGKHVSITLTGDSTERTVSLSSTGSLFTVESGVTLTLGNNLTLQGKSANTAALVTVNTGGTLVMNTGSKVSGNTSSVSGGVDVYGGTFTMSGGAISGNTVSSSSGAGGGVFVSSGTFTMSGGTISGNTSSSSGAGGGVYVSSNGTFTMSGGTISGNTASSGAGGGVFVDSGTFTMSGGAISGNTSYYGGGVFVDSGTFTMSGGTISGNTASYYGGGVYVSSSSTFTKQSGGTIYGSNASSSSKNTAYGSSYGHAVYIDSAPAKKRNTTAGTGVRLDSSVSGSSGGWE